MLALYLLEPLEVFFGEQLVFAWGLTWRYVARLVLRLWRGGRRLAFLFGRMRARAHRERRDDEEKFREVPHGAIIAQRWHEGSGEVSRQD